MEDEKKMHQVVIVGSGPAGLTAAIYLSRAGKKPVLVKGLVAGGTPPGGQLMNTTEVENFPGFPEGITGPELMERMFQQAERFKTEFVEGDITGIERIEGGFKLIVDEVTPLETKCVVVATGATARYMGLPNEDRLKGRGVSGCAVCDGAFFRDQDVVVVGGGDTAMEDSLYLTNMCKSVTIVHRRDEFRASKVMAARALKHPKIKVVWDSVVVDVLGKNGVTGVKIKNVKTGEENDYPCTGLFVAIGHTPNAKWLEGVIDRDDVGYVKITGSTSRTNVEGIFAAGDVMDKVYRQAITAAGCGCRAALDAERYLETLGD
jgi:thioredoxin reductase (NADPH)